MKTIEVENGQLLLDIALQHYGTAEAIGEIVRNNPELKNESSAVVESGRELGAFYPDIKLVSGSTVQIDDESRLIRKTVVKKINRSITTYMEAQWQERLNK
jgi:hypothetical protein